MLNKNQEEIGFHRLNGDQFMNDTTINQFVALFSREECRKMRNNMTCKSAVMVDTHFVQDVLGDSIGSNRPKRRFGRFGFKFDGQKIGKAF
jgi:hypothetical protein